MPRLTQSALAAMIDHTLLKPETTRTDIEKLCREAREFSFASVCIPPFRVAQAAQALHDCKVKVCTVIGFPLGANRAEIKAMEAVRAIADGASELDMVLNIGALKDGNSAAVENDISAVVKAAKGATVKVILETCLLSDEEIVRACRLSVSAGAQFVKTSTGFSTAGATVAHVRLMRETVGPDFGVKASGGIRDHDALMAMITAGANRIGTSSGVSLLKTGGRSGGPLLMDFIPSALIRKKTLRRRTHSRGTPLPDSKLCPG
ncbi:MAG: deoxyribose-phosphate aldolase [Calothrix sp. SM1_5_4]|nr:deoxyribose-phosphate aldolase [Calothrix sp. SM1_5_4]